MQAATHKEIAQAKQLLESKHYAVSTHENGHLIVQDPIRVCGCDGRLITCGSKPVAIRNYRDAYRFIDIRS